MTNLQKAVFKITAEFVDEVKKPMIDKYLSMQENAEERFMIDTLLEKYITEAGNAEKDTQRSFEQYVRGDKHTTLEVCCLNHERHYKLVIIDILQGKC